MITTDHNIIREWIEERDGRPAVAKSGQNGMLRIDFGEHDEGLEEVSWDEFFKIFDNNNLAFLHQGEAASGGLSLFFKFIDRGSIDDDELAEGDVPPAGSEEEDSPEQGDEVSS